MQTIDDNDLHEIKTMLSHYFFNKAVAEAQKVAEQKGWSDEEIDQLGHQHNRTPYHPTKPF